MTLPEIGPLLTPYECQQEDYLDSLYAAFLSDLVHGNLFWKDSATPLSLRRNPMVSERHAIFWHIISGGGSEESARVIDGERCRRLHWIAPMIRMFNLTHPALGAGTIRWWRSPRPGSPRFLLSTSDYSYVVVIEERPEYALLVTAYCVEQEHRRRKLQKEHDAHWERR